MTFHDPLARSRDLPHRLTSRRAFFLCGLGSAVLAGCGGGGSPAAPAPQPNERYTRIAAFVGSQHTASLLPDGAVLLAGGSRGGSTLSDAIDRVDPGSGTIERVGTLPAGRSGHVATSLPNSDILLTGGAVNIGGSSGAILVDARTLAIRAAGSMSVPRVAHAAVALRDGRVLVCGGSTTGEQAPLGISDSAELWDPATRQFRRLPAQMAVRRAVHTATLLADGRVLVVGGYAGESATGSAELFDPATETFQLVAQDLPPRANHVAHAQPDASVLVLGGEFTVGGATGTIVPLASVMRFDPRAGTFRAEPALTVPRTMSASVARSDGQVLLFGGQHAVPDYTASAEWYRPSVGGRALPPLDGSRALHTATLLPDGRVLIAGGEAGGNGEYSASLLVFG